MQTGDGKKLLGVNCDVDTEDNIDEKINSVIFYFTFKSCNNPQFVSLFITIRAISQKMCKTSFSSTTKSKQVLQHTEFVWRSWGGSTPEHSFFWWGAGRLVLVIVVVFLSRGGGGMGGV